MKNRPRRSNVYWKIYTVLQEGCNEIFYMINSDSYYSDYYFLIKNPERWDCILNVNYYERSQLLEKNYTLYINKDAYRQSFSNLGDSYFGYDMYTYEFPFAQGSLPIIVREELKWELQVRFDEKGHAEIILDVDV